MSEAPRLHVTLPEAIPEHGQASGAALEGLPTITARAAELWRRIEGRNSGTYPDRVNRFHRAYEELMYAPQYDYIVVNDDLDPCVEDIRTIYMAEGLKRARNGKLWENLAKEVVDT